MKQIAIALVLQFLTIGFACPVRSEEIDGQVLLKHRCGRCHGIKADSKSPIGPAPNLWDKLRSYPAERLAFELSEGMGSLHIAMPQIQFTDEEIAAVQSYLAGNQR